MSTPRGIVSPPSVESAGETVLGEGAACVDVDCDDENAGDGWGDSEAVDGVAIIGVLGLVLVSTEAVEHCVEVGVATAGVGSPTALEGETVSGLPLSWAATLVSMGGGTSPAADADGVVCAAGGGAGGCAAAVCCGGVRGASAVDTSRHSTVMGTSSTASLFLTWKICNIALATIAPPVQVAPTTPRPSASALAAASGAQAPAGKNASSCTRAVASAGMSNLAPP